MTQQSFQREVTHFMSHREGEQRYQMLDTPINSLCQVRNTYKKIIYKKRIMKQALSQGY